ncbi:hypothetical protein [Arthrobacter sp. H5]|uniref:hypothetical protein n=1 Tax=Arthrobacter sp. H5 TaxID=1267973 RepID=UPI0004855B55|nr:hypothetical protein [Arthrobacter sp. H5]
MKTTSLSLLALSAGLLFGAAPAAMAGDAAAGPESVSNISVAVDDLTEMVIFTSDAVQTYQRPGPQVCEPDTNDGCSSEIRPTIANYIDQETGEPTPWLVGQAFQAVDGTQWRAVHFEFDGSEVGYVSDDSVLSSVPLAEHEAAQAAIYEANEASFAEFNGQFTGTGILAANAGGYEDEDASVAPVFTADFPGIEAQMSDAYEVDGLLWRKMADERGLMSSVFVLDEDVEDFAPYETEPAEEPAADVAGDPVREANEPTEPLEPNSASFPISAAALWTLGGGAVLLAGGITAAFTVKTRRDGVADVEQV